MSPTPQSICNYLIQQSWLTREKAQSALKSYGITGGQAPFLTFLLQHHYIHKNHYQFLQKIYSSPPRITRMASPFLPKSSKPSLPPLQENYQKYHRIQELGQGGMGQVFLALDRDLMRQTALKICTLSDVPMILRFIQEAQIGSQLEHPNIAPIYDVGKTPDGKFYFAMQYLKGISMAKLLLQLKDHQSSLQSQYPLKRRLAIFCKVLEAMAYVHSRGVIHRDLKPDNIMVGHFGEVLIVDWGVAKILENSPVSGRSTSGSREEFFQTQIGSIVGTPQYISPEQALGDMEQLSHLSDIYSLGVVLYELVSLERAFSGNKAMDVLMQVSKSKFLPPSQVSDEVPPALEAVVLKAMAHSPDERYPSAGHFLKEVHAYLDDEPLDVYTPPMKVRVQRFLRRHASVLAVAGSIVVLLALFGYFLITAKQSQLVEKEKQFQLLQKQKKLVQEKMLAKKAEKDAMVKLLEAEKKKKSAVKKLLDLQTKQKDAMVKLLEAEKKKKSAVKTLLDLQTKQKDFVDRLIRAYGPYRVATRLLIRDLRYATLQKVVIPKLKEALKIQPAFVEARIQLMKVYFYSTKIEKAMGEGVKLLQYFPKKLKQKYGSLMTRILFSLNSNTSSKASLPADFDQDKPKFLDVIDWQSLKALFLLILKNLKGSEEVVDRILQRPEGRRWDICFLKIMIVSACHRWDQAETLARQYIKQYPDIPVFYYYLGRALEKKKQKAKSLFYYNKLLQMDPSFYSIWYILTCETYTQWLALVKSKDPQALEIALSILRYADKSFLLEPEFIYPKIYKKYIMSWLKGRFPSAQSGDSFSLVKALLKKISPHSSSQLKKEVALFATTWIREKKSLALKERLRPFFPSIKAYLKEYLRKNRNSLDRSWILDGLRICEGKKW